MKIYDVVLLGAKNLKSRWALLPVIGIAISVFCLCYAGAVLTAVQEEKAKPYELQISSESAKDITDSTLAKISKIPNVDTATPSLQVSAIVKTGIYSAQLTLTGINPSYLNDTFTQGGVFPADSIMPYIILNESACKQFAKAKTDSSLNSNSASSGNSKNGVNPGVDSGSSSSGTSPQTGSSSNANAKSSLDSDTGSGTDVKGATTTGTSTTAGFGLNIVNTAYTTNNSSQAGTDSDADNSSPKINWLNAGVTIQTGDNGQWIVSKICGILKDAGNGQQPVAYISLAAAKSLLLRSGQSMNYSGADVRIKNIGCASSVAQSITELGLTVTNTDDALQSKWNTELTEMGYLIVIGVFCLLCSAVLMAASRKITIVEQKETWRMLRWIGMKERDIGRLFLLQALIISIAGIAIGVIVGISLPSFLSPDLKGNSIFTLQIPFLVAVLNISICTAVGMSATINIKKTIVSDLL
jgi:ABC-type lipoprotein release transport system permease subunit